MNWTPDKDARLRAEWATGDSADDIARRLGREFKEHLTKNAIIGRAYHIPLPRRRKVPIVTSRASRPSSKKWLYAGSD